MWHCNEYWHSHYIMKCFCFLFFTSEWENIAWSYFVRARHYTVCETASEENATFSSLELLCFLKTCVAFSSTPQSFHYTNEMKEINVATSGVCLALKCKSVFLCTAVWVLNTFAYSWSWNPPLRTLGEKLELFKVGQQLHLLAWSSTMTATTTKTLKYENFSRPCFLDYYWINTMPE